MGVGGGQRHTQAAERAAAAVRQQASNQIALIRAAAERNAAATIMPVSGEPGRAAKDVVTAPCHPHAALPAATADLPSGQAPTPGGSCPRHVNQ